MNQRPDPLFATVAVDSPLDATYTYAIPARLSREVAPGSRVTVPLGRGNRLEQATVLSISDAPPAGIKKDEPKTEPADEELLFGPDGLPPAPQGVGGAGGVGGIKELADVLREVTPIPADLLELAKWISTYYCSPIGMTLASMVPAAVKRATRIPSNLLISLAQPVATIEAALAAKKISPRSRAVFEKIHPFLRDGARTEQDVLTHAQIARPLLKRLMDLGFLTAVRQIKLPEPHPIGAHTEAADVGRTRIESLTDDQSAALRDLEPLFKSPTFAVRLVHGVTGSGKTELYIRAIEHVVAQGKRAIVLVPEISLTPQTVRRFTARFPRVAVLHSGLKDSERHQHWHAIATGWAQVIVGARSAIFAPAADIGLVVVDEEHDPSYKQDSLPKYHGRDVAIRRAQMLNIPILLGSATPALESWHNAHHNPHWGGSPISLRSRPGGTLMPRVVTVDMKAEAKLRRGLHILSISLEQHLKAALEAKKQAIFLLNRRGYAHYLMCPRCDWVLMCDNCDATMVVHRTREEEARKKGNEEIRSNTRDALRESMHARGKRGARAEVRSRPIQGTVQCHYCLTAKMLPELCPLCQARLTHLGQGTQRAEDELIRKFPDLRIKRMDSDSMGNLGEYQKALDAFGRGEIDLLIGTQMISKGLDFPNVSLVGVLNSDLAMTIPDFRASERTFQLICQVAGRAGRAAGATSQGTVVVQTFQPTEPAIAHACRHDYLGFVRAELPNRKEFGYPPYGRLVRIVLSHKSYTQLHAAADELIRLISALTTKLDLPIRVHGPIPPPMERVNELYRVEIVLFSDSALPLQRLVGSLRARGALVSGRAGGVGIAVDVDPLHML
ncbi:MAG TPA: primosomal protein N' [Phycisphaerae bacterium]|nr:primosomal protein N' [Phycisphaerae bacterium]